MKNAIAHIGGMGKEDILELPDMPQLEMHLPFTNEAIPGFMETPGAKPVKMSVESKKTIEAIHNELPVLNNKQYRNQLSMKYLQDYIDGTFRLKSFPNSNVIRYNYN